MDVIIYSYYDYCQPMLVKWAPGVKRRSFYLFLYCLRVSEVKGKQNGDQLTHWPLGNMNEILYM